MNEIIKQYEPITRVVEAALFDTQIGQTDSDLERIAVNLAVWCRGEVRNHGDRDIVIVIKTATVPQIVNRGEYIVKFENGKVEVYSKEAFKKVFKEIGTNIRQVVR